MSITRIDHTIPPPFLGWPCGPPTPHPNPPAMPPSPTGHGLEEAPRWTTANVGTVRAESHPTSRMVNRRCRGRRPGAESIPLESPRP